MAVQWFCPACWAPVAEHDETCPSCDRDLRDYAGWSYELKLRRALSHPIAEQRSMAARILGELRAVAAVPDLMELAARARDPYPAAEAVRALAQIGTDASLRGLRAAHNSESAVVRAAAAAAEREINHGSSS